LDGHDRRRLWAALGRADDVRLFRRLQAVLLVCDGRSVTEAGRVTRLTRQSVHAAIGRYLQSRRADDLRDAPRSGRPPAAATLTRARIAREVRRDPLRLGYMATEWTVPLLASHLSRRYGCAVTPGTLRRRMRALGLAWKRPRHVYHLKDPHRAQKRGPSSAA
jgi:transposase